jgi:trimeric autotransporter adhesin
MTTFSYTGAEAKYTANEAGDYSVVLKGGGTAVSRGGTVSGTVFLELGTVVTFKVGQGVAGVAATGQVYQEGGWPDGGSASGTGDGSSTRVCAGAGSTSMWISGALTAIAGGAGGGGLLYPVCNGGGPIGGSGSAAANMNGGRQHAGGTGAPAVDIGGGVMKGPSEPGSFLQGGDGAFIVGTFSYGGGGEWFGGGGGHYYMPGGGGSGWVGGLKDATNTSGTAGKEHGSAVINFVGPNPSGTMPGLPLTIRVRASTDTCQVEKDITVRVLGYVVHDVFDLPALVVGTPVSYQLPLSPGTGFAPIVWTTSGTLPTGLTLSATGLLSGTPSAAATFNWSAITTDDSGATATTAVESIVAAS